MKRTLTLGLAIASLACVQAEGQFQPVKMKVSENNSKQKTGQPFRHKTVGEDRLIQTEKGKTLLRNETLTFPSMRKYSPVRKADETAMKNGFILYENFSGWDGKTSTWVPDGWTVDHKGTCNKKFSWVPVQPTQYYPAPIDGDYYYIVNDDENQDEWLISPEFTPEEDMELSYHMRLNPLWYYATKNIDWIKGEYTSDKVQVYTMQVLVKEGEGEWKVLRDYAEEYKDKTFKEIYAASNEFVLTKQTIDLSDYAGKNVKVAFRYVGTDGDSMILDAIGVGYPTLDNVWYMPPTNSLYWGFYYGFDPLMHFFQMPEDVAVFPADSDITWYNMSEEEDATYSWKYTNREGDEVETSDDQYELTSSYAPETPDVEPKLYDFPVLNAEAHHRANATYNSPVKYFQVGGIPYYPTPYGDCEFTMFQFPLVHQEIGFLDVRDYKQGAWSVPVFGHNEFTDTYWLNYCLNGEEPMEGNYAHLNGIGNIFFPAEDAALVVNGMRVYGYGHIGKGATLTATIYALDSEMHSAYDTFTVVARATASGEDVRSLNGENVKDYIYIPFEFDEAAVIKATEEHPAFVFMLEGFNSEHIDYFAPLQSWRPIESGMGAGYILSEINLQGHIDEGTYTSFKPMQYFEDKEYKDWIGTFAIGLVAEYPWLTTDTEKIELSADDNKADISLHSYYTADKLTVKCPEGLAASIKGQYDKCMLSVWRKNADNEAKGNIEISGPGVALSIPVEALSTNAVSTVNGAEGIEGIYDLSGRKVTSTSAAGVYIIKHTDGNIRKVTVK